jgi:hypothetical protein
MPIFLGNHLDKKNPSRDNKINRLGVYEAMTWNKEGGNVPSHQLKFNINQFALCCNAQ